MNQPSRDDDDDRGKEERHQRISSGDGVSELENSLSLLLLPSVVAAAKVKNTHTVLYKRERASSKNQYSLMCLHKIYIEIDTQQGERV